MYEELKELNEIIRRKQERIDELRAAATSLSVPLNQRVQNSTEDRLANLMCKIIIAENELDGLIDDFADKKMKAKTEIFTLPIEEWQDIVYMHYIEFKPMDEIAQILSKRKGRSISKDAVYMKNNRALKCLKKIIKSDNLTQKSENKA